MIVLDKEKKNIKIYLKLNLFGKGIISKNLQLILSSNQIIFSVMCYQ